MRRTHIGAKDKLALIGLTMGALVALLLSLLSTGLEYYPLDDAYIVEHSVRGIAAGREARFLDSTPWQGVTSPVYVLAILLLSLILPVAVAHWTVNALAVLLLVFGIYNLCRRYSVSEPISAAAAVGSLMAGMTFFQAVNGLETGMAMAALTWMLVAFSSETPPWWGYILVVLQCFIRPELAAFLLVLCIHVATIRPLGWKTGLISVGLTLCLAVAFQWWASDSLFPNTMSAKTYFFAEGCLPESVKAIYVLSALQQFVINLGVFALGYVLVLLSRLRWVALSFLIILLLAYFLRFPGALFHNHFRYLYLLLPLCVLGWAAGLSHSNKAFRIFCNTAGVVALFSAFLSVNDFARIHEEQTRIFGRENAQMASWVARNIPKNAVILVHDAGMVSQTGHQRLADMVGLKSVFSMEVHRRTTFQACRRIPSALSDIGRHFGANYMIVTTDWDRLFGLTESLRMTNWTVERADQERGDSHYRVYTIQDSDR